VPVGDHVAGYSSSVVPRMVVPVLVATESEIRCETANAELLTGAARRGAVWSRSGRVRV